MPAASLRPLENWARLCTGRSGSTDVSDRLLPWSARQAARRFSAVGRRCWLPANGRSVVNGPGEGA